MLSLNVTAHTSTLPKPAKLKSWFYAASPTDQSQTAALHRAALQAYTDIDRLAVMQLPIPPSPAARSVRSVLAKMRSFSCCHIACNQQRFGGLRYPRSVRHAPDRCFARLRPFGTPQKTAWAPTPLAYRGPVSLLAKLLRIYR